MFWYNSTNVNMTVSRKKIVYAIVSMIIDHMPETQRSSEVNSTM